MFYMPQKVPNTNPSFIHSHMKLKREKAVIMLSQSHWILDVYVLYAFYSPKQMKKNIHLHAHKCVWMNSAKHRSLEHGKVAVSLRAARTVSKQPARTREKPLR